MGAQLTHLTFEQWLSYVFDHPVRASGQAWYWNPAASWWECPAAESIQFMTRAFENAGELFQPYSDAQINQGLWFIADNACSNHMFALMDSRVPWQTRQRCVQSMYSLYAQCFARGCTPHLSHLDEPGASPLNPVCYMWWDLIPIIGQPADRARIELDREILGVMESTLGLNSVACQESALHGLGHWQLAYPRRVTEIIAAFLERKNDLRKELRTYAMSASKGCVL